LCVSCFSTNVLTCNGASATNALSCYTNYVFIPTAGATDSSGTCVVCATNVATCALTGLITGCVSGYYY